MRLLLIIIFVILTVFAFLGLIPPFLALLIIRPEPGQAYGPLGISNPPLAMLVVWGLVFLILLTITIKLIKD